jgi:acyl phosphate:glycerol-3-phosphate acyltransferase
MSFPVIFGLCVAGAFLCGSVPFGYFAGKLKGIDIRQHGSGNIGATNVIRVCGKGIGIPVFILDMIKGLVPTLSPQWLMTGPEMSDEWTSMAAVACGLAAILGHMFTPWLGFKGGKGVATAAGVLIGIAPVAMTVALAAWLVVFFTTKYVSLASIASAVAVPATMAALMWRAHRWDGVLLGFGILLGVLVIVRHRANIQRLFSGTESRAGVGRMTKPE